MSVFIHVHPLRPSSSDHNCFQRRNLEQEGHYLDFHLYMDDQYCIPYPRQVPFPLTSTGHQNSHANVAGNRRRQG
jgi:hypothetical protein